MKRFSCACAQPVFFHNSSRTHCGGRLGFDAERLDSVTLNASGNGVWASGDAYYRDCRNTLDYDNCNWLLSASDADDFCAV